ncbi:MAG TPA: tetratricopeptide repeat protein, partial [Polyangiaceae bacterium]|nr:tetratricopeptide repeat protein [Polyangiaceae bacterium]
ERRDDVGIRAASLNLARRIEGEDRHEALGILRAALKWAPEDPELLETLYTRLGADDDPRERADLAEALLRHEPAENAGARALELVAMYDELEDEAGSIRALMLGTQRAPTNKRLRKLLLERYRARGDFHGLADTLVDAARHNEEPERKAALFIEAARVRREELGDPEAAVPLLTQAFELVPDDHELCVELANTQSAAGNKDEALAILGGELERNTKEVARLTLLRARAALAREAGRLHAAYADLEQAFAMSSKEVAGELEGVLIDLIDEAVTRGDDSAERQLTHRSVDVILAQGKREEASQLLGTWVQRAGDDIEALRRLRDIDTEDGRWREVANTCRRLVGIESGAAQIDAALGLSHACHELGEPEQAREGLEMARRAQPDNVQVRAELRKIYEQEGDRRALAALLVDDAGAVQEMQERVSFLLRAGQLFIEVGDADAAVPALRTAHELMPDEPTTIVFLADAYILAGWLDDARDLLDRVLGESRGRRTPEVSMYYHRKAQIAAAQGDAQTQLEFLQEAHLCNKKNGIVAAELADLAEEVGQWDLAAKTLRTITLLDTECPIRRAEAFLRQGKIARVQGDEKSAKMWARRAKREDPDWPEIDAFLVELGERP